MNRSFSDFIRNASEDEKREVYERVMERATERQRKTMTEPSKTPRTDGLVAYLHAGVPPDMIPRQDVDALAEHARRLERELAEKERFISDTPRWVSVDDRLPDDAQKVLAYWKGSSCIEACESLTYHAADSPIDGPEAWINAWGERADPPTHWQPMIEAPK